MEILETLKAKSRAVVFGIRSYGYDTYKVCKSVRMAVAFMTTLKDDRYQIMVKKGGETIGAVYAGYDWDNGNLVYEGHARGVEEFLKG